MRRRPRTNLILSKHGTARSNITNGCDTFELYLNHSERFLLMAVEEKRPKFVAWASMRKSSPDTPHT